MGYMKEYTLPRYSYVTSEYMGGLVATIDGSGAKDGWQRGSTGGD